MPNARLITSDDVLSADDISHRLVLRVALKGGLASLGKIALLRVVHAIKNLPLNIVRRMLDEVLDIFNNDVTRFPDDHICNLLLFGSLKFNKTANRMILDAAVRFLVDTNRF